MTDFPYAKSGGVRYLKDSPVSKVHRFHSWSIIEELLNLGFGGNLEACRQIIGDVSSGEVTGRVQ
jgi:hypothetical protein